MQPVIHTFGQITGITGQAVLHLEEPVQDTDTLKTVLHRQYPALATVRYAIAVDKKIITGNTPVSGATEIALLPPFSGG